LREFDDDCQVADPRARRNRQTWRSRRRAEAARRITELFLQGAATFRPDHVDLFDGVLIDLWFRILNSPRGPIRLNGCACLPTPRAPWSGNSRARTRSRSQVPCLADRPSSMNRPGSKLRASMPGMAAMRAPVSRSSGTASRPHGGLRVRLCVRTASSCSQPMAGASRRPVPRSRRNRANVKDAQASTRSSLRCR
jgi:hypothetical protein